MLECVVNVSAGADGDPVDEIAAAAGADLLDVHPDPHHNRSVLTLVGEDAPRRVARAAVERARPAAPLGRAPPHRRRRRRAVRPAGRRAASPDAVAARDRFLSWIADELDVPGFAYGPERSLPDVRRRAFRDLAPDAGPPRPHPTAGAVAVGAREVLVAWNVWLAEPDLAAGDDSVAAVVRGPHLRALGLPVGDRVQVSMNLVAPDVVGPAEAWDAVAAHVPLAGAELVGLVPASVLDRTDPGRWSQLDLGEERTIEARLRRVTER